MPDAQTEPRRTSPNVLYVGDECFFHVKGVRFNGEVVSLLDPELVKVRVNDGWTVDVRYEDVNR